MVAGDRGAGRRRVAAVHAVVNRIRLREPLPARVFADAHRDLEPRVQAMDGLHSIHLIRAGDDQLVVVILAETEAALERTREEIGNEWMRANVIPYAAGPPERVTGEVAASLERSC